jgi:hypothetical protein
MLPSGLLSLPVPELWWENTSGFARTGGTSTDSSKSYEQNCKAPYVTFSTENRMSVALPVPRLWRENTSGFAKTGGSSRDSSKVHEANL